MEENKFKITPEEKENIIKLVNENDGLFKCLNDDLRNDKDIAFASILNDISNLK